MGKEEFKQKKEIKKRQIVVMQFTEKNLEVEEDKIIAHSNRENFVQTSSTLLLRQMERLESKNNVHIGIENLNQFMNENDCREFNADAYVQLISIEFGKVTNNNTELIDKCIKEGFYIKEKHYKYISATGGSHIKKVKQFYVREEIHEELEKIINLKDSKYCIVPKRLTSNALLTTSIWEMPYNLSELNICILPENSINKVFKDRLETLVPYTYDDFTEEEKEKHDDMEQYKINRNNYNTLEREYKKEGKIKDLLLATNHKGYKTPARWLYDNNRLVMEEEICNPKYKNKSDRIIYAKNQTIELKYNILETAEWSLGYKACDYNEPLEINNFDGMGLIGLKLGNKIREFLAKKDVNGCQLRIPQMKGFYPIVDFNGYFKEKNITHIYDVFGYKWNVDNIDIITTESTFKAKIETDETGKEKKWLWDTYQEYQQNIVAHGYDCIGIANYTHKRNENEYRALSYQFLEALNATEYDLLALASEHGKMLYNILNIYRENRESDKEINWEDIKYIKVYLQNLLENENNNDEYIATALKCINLNKYMIFDKKFTNFLLNEICRELESLGLGQIKVKSNYLYVCTDILGFLRYCSQFQNDKCCDAKYRKELSHTEIEGTLKENKWYCKGVVGNKVMYRNPMMAQSEIFKADFISLFKHPDYKYVKHLDNMIQAPMNTYAFQQATFDVDGDKFQLIHLDHNLKDINLEWLINYDFISDIEINNLEILEEKMKLYHSKKFKDTCTATISDLILDNIKIMVNPSDGQTIAGQEWNLDNISDFIQNCEDKTGVITDYNTIALNQFNSLKYQYLFSGLFEDLYKKNKIEFKFQDYKTLIKQNEKDDNYEFQNEEEFHEKMKQLRLTNKYCKFFQGIIIDTSKRGGTVEIAPILKMIYRNKPKFYCLKGTAINNIDVIYNSHMDRFYKKMMGLKKTISCLFNKKVPEMITNHQLYFTPKLIQDSSINNYSKLQKLQEKFIPIIQKYSEKNSELMTEKKSINRFSKDDIYKEQRLLIKEKFKKLNNKITKKALKICPNDLVLAQSIWQHVYNGDSNALAFAWIVAEKGFIYNLQQHQSEKYNVELVKYNNANADVFEYFGDKYKLTISQDEIEYYKQEDLNLDRLEKFRIEDNHEKIEDVNLLFVSYKQHYKDDKENYVENVLKDITDKEFLLKECNGFIQLADERGDILLGINSKELDYSAVDIANKTDYKVKFKEIERLYSGKGNEKKINKTAFNATVDLYV